VLHTWMAQISMPRRCRLLEHLGHDGHHPFQVVIAHASLEERHQRVRHATLVGVLTKL